jgi:hypothetical protein
MVKEVNAVMQTKEEREAQRLEISKALEDTLITLIKNGFNKDKGVYHFEGSMSDIMVDTSWYDGKWLGIFQRLDNE